MDLSDRIEAFSQLGTVINQVLEGDVNQTDLPLYAVELSQLIFTFQDQNPWFTPDNIKAALSAIAHSLSKENLITWTGRYPSLNGESIPKRIGVTMAGNIPLVGFHDFLSVLMSGHHFIGKPSSKDDRLLPAIAQVLTELQQGFSGSIDFIEGPFTTIDAIIATGSDNSARYFAFYFAKYPNIIRRNRNGIAILDGSESCSDLYELGEDIFRYFGLGCRSISKIYVPTAYDFNHLIDALQAYNHLEDHQKYRNNYIYNRAKYIIRQIPFIDSGFLLFREEPEIASPPGVIHFEYYNKPEELKKRLDLILEKVQCIVSLNKQFNPVGFGKTQHPDLWEYADKIDTMEFLLSLNN